MPVFHGSFCHGSLNVPPELLLFFFFGKWRRRIDELELAWASISSAELNDWHFTHNTVTNKKTILNLFWHFLSGFQVNGVGKTKSNCFSMKAKRELELNLNLSLNRWLEKARMKTNKALYLSVSRTSNQINTILDSLKWSTM